jgi:hypothetical protein
LANFVAIFDACVLYPAPLRDLLIRLALTGLFRAKWSASIHDEWTRSVLANRPDLTPAQLRRTRDLMDRTVPDCLVSGHEGLIAQLNLPDANDRHVLAAAIRAQAGVIVTFNSKDFPASALAPYNIEVQHPDEFISHLFDLSAALVTKAVRDQRAALKHPPKSSREMLDTLLVNGLATTVASLETMIELL